MRFDTISDAETIGGSVESSIIGRRYRVVRQLGHGGMGSVWLVEDIQLDNRLFALKMLPSVLVSNKRAYRQLKDEALVAMKLTHPNIVTLRAFDENSGNPFLVMDYIDGQTLDDILADKGTLSEQEMLEILRPVAQALDFAHSRRIVHRDVKPCNVIIASDGTPYILDFGIAREIQETLTRVTGKLSSGTLMYMSPEQLNGAAPKPSQDVYSFAAMAYECLKGAPPFSRGQIEYQIINNAPENLDENTFSCAHAIMSGLAKTPEKRPVTCADVLKSGKQADPQKPMEDANRNHSTWPKDHGYALPKTEIHSPWPKDHGSALPKTETRTEDCKTELRRTSYPSSQYETPMPRETKKGCSFTPFVASFVVTVTIYCIVLVKQDNYEREQKEARIQAENEALLREYERHSTKMAASTTSPATSGELQRIYEFQVRLRPYVSVGGKCYPVIAGFSCDRSNIMKTSRDVDGWYEIVVGSDLPIDNDVKVTLTYEGKTRYIEISKSDFLFNNLKSVHIW